MAYEQAKLDAKRQLAEPVPLQLRNAPTALMKELHYGEQYEYAHDTEEKLTHMQCLPESMRGRRYYHPGKAGAEAEIAESLRAILAWKGQEEGR